MSTNYDYLVEMELEPLETLWKRIRELKATNIVNFPLQYREKIIESFRNEFTDYKYCYLKTGGGFNYPIYTYVLNDNEVIYIIVDTVNDDSDGFVAVGVYNQDLAYRHIYDFEGYKSIHEIKDDAMDLASIILLYDGYRMFWK